MFDSLSDRFENIFKGLRSKGKLRESDVDEALREIRVALLEADVNVSVVKGFRDRVRERSIGAGVHEALNPAQQIVKIVHEELIATLGGETMHTLFRDTDEGRLGAGEEPGRDRADGKDAEIDHLLRSHVVIPSELGLGSSERPVTPLRWRRQQWP